MPVFIPRLTAESGEQDKSYFVHLQIKAALAARSVQSVAYYHRSTFGKWPFLVNSRKILFTIFQEPYHVFIRLNIRTKFQHPLFL